MADRFTEQLSPYLDGELDDLSRARLEAHLATCLECTRTLADLKAIVAAAPEYPGREPTRDLWPEIAARRHEAEVVPLSSAGAPVRPSARFAWRHLIAASIAMAAVSGGTVWFALTRTTTPPPLARAPDTLAPVAGEPRLRNAAVAEQEYDAAVRDLEDLLAAGRDRLDPATLRTIETSLSRIDAAIAEARAAIQRDSTSAYLSRQIAANMRRKLNLLRTATHAIAART